MAPIHLTPGTTAHSNRIFLNPLPIMPGELLHGVRSCVFNYPQFYQAINASEGSGLEKLLKASKPEAFHDSGSRDPPRCHPDTRLDYIDRICNWSSGTSQHSERILWMQGPAGVGKSAIAQSCAEFLAKRNRLGAAFFFSRPNNMDDPACLFTSISYQIATKSTLYSNNIDARIRNDPTLVIKSIASQFDELLVKPLEELGKERSMEDYVIIIDGLDECAGVRAQQEIVALVAKSVKDVTTPFRWAFFSRPESSIITSFTSEYVGPISLHLELPVSREIDHEILCYLSAEFKRIREEHGLLPSWPSERDLRALVDQSAGLFIYASTVIRFVGERNSLGPVDQLHLVLLLKKQSTSCAGSDHPLSELDLFYTLIMRCVPSRIRPIILKILLLRSTAPPYDLGKYSEIHSTANALGLSEPQFRGACTALRSVLELRGLTVRFYHASFMEFLGEPHRSKEFCIYGDCLDTAREELLERLNHVHAQSQESLSFDLTWLRGSRADGETYRDDMYKCLVNSFFVLCSFPRPLSSSTAVGLAKFQFPMLLRLYDGPNHGGDCILPVMWSQNIPGGLRDKVIRQSANPAAYFRKTWYAKLNRPYILGQGKNRVVWRKSDTTIGELHPYPSIWKL